MLGALGKQQYILDSHSAAAVFCSWDSKSCCRLWHPRRCKCNGFAKKKREPRSICPRSLHPISALVLIMLASTKKILCSISCRLKFTAAASPRPGCGGPGELSVSGSSSASCDRVFHSKNRHSPWTSRPAAPSAAAAQHYSGCAAHPPAGQRTICMACSAHAWHRSSVCIKPHMYRYRCSKVVRSSASCTCSARVPPL